MLHYYLSAQYVDGTSVDAICGGSSALYMYSKGVESLRRRSMHYLFTNIIYASL